MSVFITSETRVLVQGMTGSEGSFWSKHMIDLGTNVVAGVTPGKGGQTLHGVPVFNTVRQAVEQTNTDASALFVPPRFAKDAIFEALDAGIRKMLVTADGIPLQEAIELRRAALDCGALIVGGNSTGAITPDVASMGAFPYWIKRVYTPGRIGVMTRSGSLTNEVTATLVAAGFGASTIIGIGGDPVPLTRFSEMLPHFQEDPDTDAVLIIGELGGTMEEEVAEAIKRKEFTKPLVAFIAGRTAPEGKKMGHAGAIFMGNKGTPKAKIEALEKAGALVARRPSEVGELFQQAFSSSK